MNRPLILLVISGLCVATGMASWLIMAWKAVTGLENVTPQSDTGGSLMGWAVSGTLLMITGMIMLHFAADMAEETRQEEKASSDPRDPE